MITSSNIVNTIEEVFYFVLKIDLTFKRLVLIKAQEQCPNCEGYGHYDYQCPLECQHVITVFSDTIDNL